MSGLLTLVLMATMLGVGSFAVGVLPLSFTFSKMTLACLSSLGTGLLLGTALGVIIPEGVETIATTNSSTTFPTTTIALALIGGFSFMLLVEPVIHSVSAHGGPAPQHAPLPTSDPTPSSNNHPSADLGTVEFDVELGELEQVEGIAADVLNHTAPMRHKDITLEESAVVAYPLTLGLMVHALADGFALGSSAVAPVDKSLSLVVFLALLVHKAPTVLALTTSLLATSLPRSECRKHVAVFSASTPVGAFFSYALLSVVRINSEGNWTGVAMLLSGGTFLYVATVLQPGKASSEALNERLRLSLTIIGILIPVMIGAVLGHDG